MNALKHGFRSERVAEEVESSYAFEERRRTWLAQSDAQTDMDEFLITSNVILSFNLERVWRAAAACLDREKESAGDKAIEQVQELASRLYFDPTGPTSKYGLEMVVFDEAGTSTSGATDDAYQPAKLVNQLEATAVGCTWLLHEWGLLRDRAVNGLWYSLDRLKAIRLLGCQPVDAIDQWQVAMIYVASNGLMRLGETGFEDLGSDMSEVALERLLPRVKARFRDLFFDWTEADFRQMLIDLVDENVEPLQAKLEWHKRQNARCGGDRNADELGFDDSPRGARMRQYELRCKSSLERGVARFNKLAQDRVKGCCETRRGARTKSGGGNERRKERRPTVVVAARSETCAEHVMVVGRGAKGRRPTVVVTAATIRVPRDPRPNFRSWWRAAARWRRLSSSRAGMGTGGAEAGCFRYPGVWGVPSVGPHWPSQWHPDGEIGRGRLMWWRVIPPVARPPVSARPLRRVPAALPQRSGAKVLRTNLSFMKM